MGVGVEGSRTACFGEGGNVAGYDGAAGEHGLDYGKSEAFVERGIGEGSGAGVEGL